MMISTSLKLCSSNLPSPYAGPSPGINNWEKGVHRKNVSKFAKGFSDVIARDKNK